MITGFLALIVAFFVAKGVGVAVLRAGAKALGYGLATVAQAGGERIKSRIAQAKGTLKTGPGGTDDFGRVVFGSDAKYIDAVAANTIDAIATKLSTAEGKAEAAKRLAGTKRGA